MTDLPSIITDGPTFIMPYNYQVVVMRNDRTIPLTDIPLTLKEAETVISKQSDETKPYCKIVEYDHTIVAKYSSGHKKINVVIIDPSSFRV